MPRPITVVDYDPAWPVRFDELREVLAAVLGDVAQQIEHVGSTSVPGLAAKPILDIDVVIEDRRQLSEAVDRLARVGYRYKGDRGVPGREAFDWGEHEFDAVPLDGSGRRWPRHHLYVCARDAEPLRRHLALRDRLRSHPEERDAYAELKHRLAVAFRNDRPGYGDAKSGFIETILTRTLGLGFCTSRLVLRPFNGADAVRAHEVFADPEVMRYSAGGPDQEMAATLERIGRYAQIQKEHGFSKWAVWDMVTGAYLGDAGLTVLPGSGEVELGYRLGQRFWGRGYATEVARAWLRHAFVDLRLERVIAFADPRNTASIHVMKKLGMTFDRWDHLAGMDCVVYERRGGEGP